MDRPVRMTSFDVTVVADPRQGGADGRSLAATLQAAAEAGYRTAFLAFRGPAGAPSVQVAPALRRLLDRGAVTWLDPDRPVETRLAVVHHVRPLLRGKAFWSRLRVGHAVLRVDQPILTADGEPLLDLGHLRREAEALLGREPEIVAADPMVAARLPPELAGSDPSGWPPITTLTGGHADDLPRELRRLGRHVLGGMDAVPAAPLLAAAYPSEAPFSVRLAESATRLAAALPSRPAAWRLEPDELADPGAFFTGLDAYVMAVGERWQAHALPALAEAVVAARLLLLPRALEPWLGEAAFYPDDPDDVARLYAGLEPEAASQRRRAAIAFHRRCLGPEALVARVGARIGPPAAASSRLRLGREMRVQRNVLFLSPNGVGMGHLTRLLAIARRCPGSVRPVILSMSQAVGVVEDFGFMGEYLPYHEHTGENAEVWSQALRARLSEAIAFYDARCVVFDGNVPYQGLVRARLDHPSRPFVWVRRGMWRAEAGRAAIERERHFDLVIEPGDYAAADDPGITPARSQGVARVAPITLLEPGELLDRDAARAELGLDPTRPAVIVQLGGRNNFDYGRIDAILAEILEKRPDVQPVVLEWLIGERTAPADPRFRSLRTFPAARYFRAFDLAVSACGYNSFHELLSLGVPAILVPNENPMMDAQETRALWAERHGRAVCVRHAEPYRMAWAFARLLDPVHWAALADHPPLPACTGAAEAARLIAELAGSSTTLPAEPHPTPILPR